MQQQSALLAQGEPPNTSNYVVYVFFRPLAFVKSAVTRQYHPAAKNFIPTAISDYRMEVELVKLEVVNERSAKVIGPVVPRASQ